MSVTNELRAILEERGVEWWAEESEIDHVTVWNANGGHARFYEPKTTNHDLLQVGYYDCTPAQAVEATLGRETCNDMSDSAKHADVAFECSECGCWVAYDEYWETGIYICVDEQPMHIHPHFCPNCGREVVE